MVQFPKIPACMRLCGLIIAFSIAAIKPVHAQSDDFCEAIGAIIRDAPNQFLNIRGKMFSSGKVPSWQCGIKVPGTFASLFIMSNGLFYEGEVFQSVKKDSIKYYYDKYKAELDKCLPSREYKLVKQDNFYPGLEQFKKLAWMPEISGDARLESTPSHVTMEATYSKDIQRYTIVIYVFDH